jgi:hypothetical protein
LQEAGVVAGVLLVVLAGMVVAPPLTTAPPLNLVSAAGLAVFGLPVLFLALAARPLGRAWFRRVATVAPEEVTPLPAPPPVAPAAVYALAYGIPRRLRVILRWSGLSLLLGALPALLLVVAVVRAALPAGTVPDVVPRLANPFGVILALALALVGCVGFALVLGGRLLRSPRIRVVMCDDADGLHLDFAGERTSLAWDAVASLTLILWRGRAIGFRAQGRVGDGDQAKTEEVSWPAGFSRWRMLVSEGVPTVPAVLASLVARRSDVTLEERDESGADAASTR